MEKTYIFGLLSLSLGIVGCFFSWGIGIVISISIMGIGIMSCLEK